MSWFDFFLLFLAIWCIFIGAKKGLLMQAAQFFSTVVAFIVAVYWGSSLGEWLGAFFPIDRLLENIFSDASPELIFDETIIPEDILTLQPELVDSWMNETLLSLAGFTIVFLFTLFILFYFCRALKIINAFPLIGPANVVGGSLIALFKGILIFFIFLALASLFSSKTITSILRSSAFISLLSYYFESLYALVSEYLIKSFGSDFTW